jgi:hypothetical protein
VSCCVPLALSIPLLNLDGMLETENPLIPHTPLQREYHTS